MDLSVGEPVKKRETSELNDSVAFIPKTIITMPTANSASPIPLFILFFVCCRNHPAGFRVSNTRATESSCGCRGNSEYAQIFTATVVIFGRPHSRATDIANCVRRPSIFAAPALNNRSVNFRAALARSLLNATDQLLFLALDVLQIVVSELGELLFQFALHDVPVSLESKRIHIGCCIWFRLLAAQPAQARTLLQATCRLELRDQCSAKPRTYAADTIPRPALFHAKRKADALAFLQPALSGAAIGRRLFENTPISDESTTAMNRHSKS